MKLFLSLLSLFLFLAPNNAQAEKPAETKGIRIIINTTAGEIHGTLFHEQTPVTVTNFLNLAKQGYYDGLAFHRVIANFMIQGGDPTGSGNGGPGYTIQDEFAPNLSHSKAGIFSMANRGPNTGGSQFFITHLPTQWLDQRHSIFGEVTKGQEVVDKIKKGDKIQSIQILDDVKALFASQAKNLQIWNDVLKTQEKRPQ